MKKSLLLLLPLSCVLATSPKEVTCIDTAHTFKSGFSCSETYRDNDIVVIVNCFDSKWSIHISTAKNNYRRIIYSDYYGAGGGGIYKLYAGDFDSDGNKDLMACLYNGGRLGAGAN